MKKIMHRKESSESEESECSDSHHSRRRRFPWIRRTRSSRSGSDSSTSRASTSHGASKELVKGSFLNSVSPGWMDDNPADVVEGSPVQSIKSYDLSINASLMIMSRSKINSIDILMKKMELWKDRYSGSLASYPIYTLFYILLGAKISETKTNYNTFEYKSSFSGVVRLGRKDDQPVSNLPPMSLSMTEGVGSSYYSILISIGGVLSNRTGTTYPELFKLRGSNYAFYSAAQFFGLNVTIDPSGLICLN